MACIRYIKPDFVEFLRLFQFNRKYIKVGERGGKLDIVIEGPWLHVIMFEIPVLKIVHEVYSRNMHDCNDLDEGRKRLREKILMFNGYISGQNISLPARQIFPITDFGARRCFTGEWHEEVVKTLFESGVIVGTSDVMLGMLYGIPVFGTMAHEAIQAGQALGPRLVDSERFMLQKWVDEYRGDLGIALTDTLGIDKFLVDFDLYFAKLYDGVRHDSGDPFEWGEKMIGHYRRLKIEPRTKTAVFSDGLDFELAAKINNAFYPRINTSFGIGTNLTNDVGYPALQNVIKMVECNGQPVAKISDNPSKSMCEDAEFQGYLTSVVKRDVERHKVK
jgi:nicotinate phosphoribosyltransferase